MIPKEPITIKVILHPNATNRAAIRGGATTDPIEAPALNKPCAIALSFIGNHSALLFTAPGQLPASEIPRVLLKKARENKPLTVECKKEDIPQTPILITYPILVPTLSKSLPENSCPKA